MVHYLRFLLIPLLLLVGTFGYAQLSGIVLPLDAQNRVTYQEVVKLDSSLSQNAIFVELRKWCVSAFNDAESAIQFEDASSGTIKGKSSVPIAASTMMGKLTDCFRFEFCLEAKNGRYRYTFEKFTYHHIQSTKVYEGRTAESMYFTTQGKGYQKYYLDFLEQMDNSISQCIRQLKQSMVTAKKADDW
jgi:Domain of unknown function (DUF4468) with TBP-like fold